jgi:biotin carboxyl carrier protein
MSRLTVTVEGYSFEIELTLPPHSQDAFDVQVNDEVLQVIAPDLDAALEPMAWFIVNNRSYEVSVDPEFRWLRSRWGLAALEVHDLELPVERLQPGNGRIKAPIPGQVSQVMVAEGEQVQAGQPLLVLEAMKMENEIRAPLAGRVKALNAAAGQRVALHEVLVEIE